VQADPTVDARATPSAPEPAASRDLKPIGTHATGFTGENIPERQSPPVMNRGARSVVGDARSLRRAVVEADQDVLRIRGRGVPDVLRRARLKPLYAGTVQGWMLDRCRLDDALVALERAGYTVALEDAAPTPPPAPTSSPAWEQARELGLW